MTNIILAVAVLTVSFVGYVIYSSIKMYRMTKNMDTLAECLLALVTRPEDVDIVEDYRINNQNSTCAKSDWNFPNSTGF